MDKPHNPPAFPVVFTIAAGSNDLTGAITEVAQQHVLTGMELRDYFAAKAMQGALAGVPGPHLTPNRCAEEAYAMADAMLKARG